MDRSRLAGPMLGVASIFFGTIFVWTKGRCRTWKPLLLRSTALIVAVVCVPVTAGGQTPPKKYALLIGLNEYLHPATVPELTYAENDVDELALTLKGQGYRVTKLINGDAQRDRVVSELYKFATIVEEGDDFLLYFAGHGVRNRFPSRRTYWLTYDSQLDLLDVSAIRLQHLLDYVADIPARRKLLLLDHCFSGDIVVTPPPEATRVAAAVPAPGPAPLAPPAAPAPPAPAPARAAGDATRDATGQPRLERGAFPLREIRGQVDGTADGMVIIGAARASAFELAPLKHGLFTAALLNALTNIGDADLNHDAKLSVDELKAFLPREMKRLSNADQEMLESTRANNTALWFVSDNLPIPQPVDAEQKKKIYTDKLGNWEQLHWISNLTKQRCWQVVIDWVESIKDPAKKLSDDNQRLVDRVRVAMEGPAAFEKARADELNKYVEALPSP